MAVDQDLLLQVINAGLQLSPDAFNLIQRLPGDKASQLVARALKTASENPQQYIIDAEFLTEVAKPRPRPKTAPGGSVPLASQVESSIQVHDPGEAKPAGNLDGFVDYFNSRFHQLSAIIRQRMEVRDAVPLSLALGLPVRKKFKTIGIVTQKRSHGDKTFLELEDPECSATVMVTGKDAIEKSLEVINDQVICIEGFKFRDDLLLANNLVWPDVPIHDLRKADKPVCAVIIGDVHVGSKYFREDLFDKFVDWLNLELGPPPTRELASRVKYLIIAGDLVDGVGIYPNQIEELTLLNQRDQYTEAAHLLSRLPEYIEIIVTPGNHDAVRRSLPQPAVPESYAPELYKNPRVHMLPNPSYVSLHGVEALIIHGKGMDDILSSTPGYEFSHPVKALELLVRCRTVAPIYGQTTPIAPERVDRLVIKQVPDFVAAGHIHIHEYRKYKGISLITSGSFQSQTPFQKRMKLTPTPGVISVFNLQNHQHIPLDLERLN